MIESRLPPIAPIQVTRAVLPPLDDYLVYLRQIWESKTLTNNGPLLVELEQRLTNFLGVDEIWITSSGMSALLIAIEAESISGEVITTPFSYVATSNAITWQKCQPIFADIQQETLTIDPDHVERLITSRTQAILATHVYGMPCDVDRLQSIAHRYGLKLIYDAAHAFGSEYRGRALASFGDMSCLSFHATKTFSTGEGGAVVVNSPHPELGKRVRHMRSFGHVGDEYRMSGINAKCSELHAALGLCNLPLVKDTIQERRHICEIYDVALSDSPIRRVDFKIPDLIHNYAYYPILFPDENTLLRAQANLSTQSIFPRRYFWPALNQLDHLRGADCPIAEQVASTVLCLPVSQEMTAELVELTSDCIKNALA